MPPTAIKICGIRDLGTLMTLPVIDPTPRYFGLNFIEGSPRRVTQADARQMTRAFYDTDYMQWVEPVLLFANQPFDFILETADRMLSPESCLTIQLHGDEDKAFIEAIPEHLSVIKAVPFDPVEIKRWRGHERLHALLIDAPRLSDELTGGTGRQVDWHALAAIDRAGLPPLMLAGGLNPDNVAEAIRIVRPYAVDVSSGVESKRGVKDPAKIAAFCAAVRQADQAGD